LPNPAVIIRSAEIVDLIWISELGEVEPRRGKSQGSQSRKHAFATIDSSDHIKVMIHLHLGEYS
jgi:hypothetical protein